MAARLVLVTGSTVVHIGKCLLHGLTLAADGGAAEADMYDGVNANAERKAHLEALTTTTSPLCLGGPAEIHNGIYIVTTATYGIVMVEYEPVEHF